MRILKVNALLIFCLIILSMVLIFFSQKTHAEVRFRGDANVSIGTLDGVYTRTHAMDNLPFIFETQQHIGYSNPNVWYYYNRQECGGLDGKVDLPIVGSINNQDIYKVTDDIGIIVWMGDTKFSSAKPMTGNQWKDVFSGWCSQSSQGLSVYAKPVILSRHQTNAISVPKIKIGSVKWRPYGSSSVSQGLNTTVNIYLNPFTANNIVTACELTSPASVNLLLPSISGNSIPSPGSEVLAGITRISLRCPADVSVRATLTDASNPANRSDVLTLTDSSTAKGVALKLYKDDDVTPIKFGPDSPRKGNENQWQLSTADQRVPTIALKVYYYNTGEGISPGTVNGITTFTFSYQ
ncbi:TPA: fimbrial protein [Escherichia coli]|nr:fimbrial protein [Escherichia coli]